MRSVTPNDSVQTSWNNLPLHFFSYAHLLMFKTRRLQNHTIAPKKMKHPV